MKRAKHWTTEEIATQLAEHKTRGYVRIVLGDDDSAPNYASTSTRVWGPGSVTYRVNASGGISTFPAEGAVVL